MSKVVKVSSFEDFVNSTSGARQVPAAYQAWPKEAIAEVVEVLRRNDAGAANVSAAAMVERLRTAYACSTCSLGTLQTMLIVAMGRRSWRFAK